MTLVVNGDVVAGTIRTLETTYRIRSAGNGLHTVSEVDLSRLPPLGEPILVDAGRSSAGGATMRAALTRYRNLLGAFPLMAVMAMYSGMADNAFAQDTIATDRAALVALYDATDGPITGRTAQTGRRMRRWASGTG